MIEFDYIIDVPSDVTLPQMIESVNAWLSVLSSNPQDQEKTANADYTHYEALDWEDRESFQNREDISTYGVKMLPGAGAFYYANYADDTHAVQHIAGTNLE